MKHPIHHPHSPVRIFAFSILVTLTVLIGALVGKGLEALFITLILIAVEVSFSFDNAILNARILSKMSKFWQNMFLTVGVLIAVFGMRVVFPILIVALTADLSWAAVLDLALHHPEEYSHKLEEAHPSLTAFGGAFLMVLALDFFIDDKQDVTWITRIEHNLRKLAKNWAPPLITLGIVSFVSLLPANHHKKETFIAGLLGIVTYSVIHGLTQLFAKVQERRMKKVKQVGPYVGMAAFISFLYLEVLDATFSFDGVLGAFAVTQDVVLIAIGLGVGALWVRSLTIYMVRRGTLGSYKYIEHGAHYTIGILASILFLGLFVHVPEVITGLAGIGVIIASIIASRQAIAANIKAGS